MRRLPPPLACAPCAPETVVAAVLVKPEPGEPEAATRLRHRAQAAKAAEQRASQSSWMQPQSGPAKILMRQNAELLEENSRLHGLLATSPIDMTGPSPVKGDAPTPDFSAGAGAGAGPRGIAGATHFQGARADAGMSPDPQVNIDIAMNKIGALADSPDMGKEARIAAMNAARACPCASLPLLVTLLDIFEGIALTGLVDHGESVPDFAGVREALAHRADGGGGCHGGQRGLGRRRSV